MAEFELYRVLSPLFGFIMLGYVGYCFSKEGTHSRGKGWLSKEEAPKTFIANQLIYTILSIILILSPLLNSFFIKK